MDIEKVNPELRKAYSKIPPVPFYSRTFLAMMRFASKFRSRPAIVDGVKVVEHTLSNKYVRVYQPESGGSGAGLLWIHGGGYVMGDASVNDRECVRYVKELNITVVSAGYRLAPVHSFPAASDDCYEAWQWFIDNATSLGVDPQRIVISGQSAGGGLAAGLVQRVMDHSPVKPVAQALLCPMLDDRTGANTSLDALKHRLWNNKCNRAAWTYYLGQPAGSEVVPEYAAPGRREDLNGFPPTWLGVGDIDLFYEEDCRYIDRLKAAGVECETHIAAGAPHGFELFVLDSKVVQDFWASNFAFLRKSLRL